MGASKSHSTQNKIALHAIICPLISANWTLAGEYNMLYLESKGGVVIIDVSQSVEHDHPHAAEFLRKDCANVNAFFGKARAKGEGEGQGALQPMSTRQLYEFIVDDSLPVAPQPFPHQTQDSPQENNDPILTFVSFATSSGRTRRREVDRDCS